MATSYTVGKHYESFIQELVKSGRYSTASEVMRDGLRLIEEREESRKAKLDALRSDIQKGLDNGPSAPWDVVEMLTEARRRKAAGFDEK